MGSAGRFLVIVATLLVERCAAEDLCDTAQCEQPDMPLCARSSEDETPALFPDLCVLRCTNCRLEAAGVGVEYTVLNDSAECEDEAIFIRDCPEEINGDNDEKLIDDIGIIDMEDEDYDDADDVDLEAFAEDGLLMPSFPDGMLGRLLGPAMSVPSQPEPKDGSLTIVDADVKVNVQININPTPRPGGPFKPPPPPPPPMPALMAPAELPLPAPVRFEYWVPEGGAYSSGPCGPRASFTIVVAFSVLVVAVLCI